ncbi:MAG: UvrABC system protein C [Microgenomates bacterium OLB22]|nr:MAG: UvrABC system protein C [Microgenomates bacterium OLB22]
MITREHIQDIPLNSGIYIFKKGGVPIYIGKSISLKARVASHIQAAALIQKERAIVHEADTIEYQVTLTDFDAITLEAHLIRQHKPRYNVIWKDDKKFLYIKITKKDNYPKIILTRAEDDGSSLYFGPFQSMRVAESVLKLIRHVVPFCTQQYIGNRACFYAKLGLCSPCPSVVSHLGEAEERMARRLYRRNIRRVITILSGNHLLVTSELQKELKRYTDAQDFENAIRIRDRLKRLNHLLYYRRFHSPNDFLHEDTVDLRPELQEFVREHFAETVDVSDYRIECYDQSTLQFGQSVGSMVVYRDGMFEKKSYRRFRITMGQEASDFDMLRDTLMRRLKRHLKDWGTPTLIILDGGRPQLHVGQQVLEQLGLLIPMVGLAKNPDRLIIPGVKKPIALTNTTALYRVFQALRDESHRFANKYHVLLRKKKAKIG